MEQRISVDDGSIYDFVVADRISRAGLLPISTFYIPVEYTDHEMMDENGLSIFARVLHNNGGEIGAHTYSHKKLSTLSGAEALLEMTAGKKYIEDLIGREVTKLSYPRGWYNEETKEMAKVAGFLEARTMKLGVTDRTGFDNYEIPVTCHVRPRKENGFEDFEKLFEKAKTGGYFHLVLHGWEVEEFALWGVLEKILHTMYEYQSSSGSGENDQSPSGEKSRAL